MTKRKQPIYALMFDIVIPAGTRIYEGPINIQYKVPVGEAIIGHGPDTTSHWLIDLEEAQDLGIIKEIK